MTDAAGPVEDQQAPGAFRPLTVVVVANLLPYPPASGMPRRVFHLIKHLAKRHHVIVVSHVDDETARQVPDLEEHVAQVVPVRRPQQSVYGRRARQAAAQVGRLPYFTAAGRTMTLQRALDATLAAHDVDIVQIESSTMGWLDVPDDVPVIIDEHNIESELLTRMAASERTRLRRSYNRVEASRYRRFEEHVWAGSAACATTSQRDADQIRQRRPGTQVAVIPNGADVETFVPADGEPAPDSVIFVGLLDYRPNHDGALWLVDEIWPRVRELRPSATLTIVGSGPRALLERLSSESVTATGWVTDVRPYLSGASVSVVPLRIGGGTRLKILDAMAMGVPVVSTHIGAEGIDAVEGEHIVYGDTVEELASRTAGLLGDPAARARMSRSARRLVEQRYSWAHAAGQLEALYYDVLAPGSNL
jgi:polysaccharide biosynthesis protein PslH